MNSQSHYETYIVQVDLRIMPLRCALENVKIDVAIWNRLPNIDRMITLSKQHQMALDAILLKTTKTQVIC